MVIFTEKTLKKKKDVYDSNNNLVQYEEYSTFSDDEDNDEEEGDSDNDSGSSISEEEKDSDSISSGSESGSEDRRYKRKSMASGRSTPKHHELEIETTIYVDFLDFSLPKVIRTALKEPLSTRICEDSNIFFTCEYFDAQTIYLLAIGNKLNDIEFFEMVKGRADSLFYCPLMDTINDKPFDSALTITADHVLGPTFILQQFDDSE